MQKIDIYIQKFEKVSCVWSPRTQAYTPVSRQFKYHFRDEHTEFSALVENWAFPLLGEGDFKTGL